MKRISRKTIMITVFAVCAALLLSFLFIAVCADHDCLHDDCEVCRAIDMCVQSVTVFAGISTAAVFTVFAAFAAAITAFVVNIRENITPITLKVRLRN